MQTHVCECICLISHPGEDPGAARAVQRAGRCVDLEVFHFNRACVMVARCRRRLICVASTYVEDSGDFNSMF